MQQITTKQQNNFYYSIRQMLTVTERLKQMMKFIKAKNKSRYNNEVIINIDYIVRLYQIDDEYFVDLVWDLNRFYSISEDDYNELLKLKAGDKQ